MSNIISKKSNFIYNLLSNIIFAFINWIFLIIIIRFEFIEEAGYYVLAIAILSPLSLIFNLQIRNGIVVNNGGLYEISDFINLRLISNLGMLLSLFLLMIIVDENWVFILIFLSLGIVKVIENTSEVLYGYFQKEGDMVTPSKLKMKKIIIAFLVFLLIFFILNDFIFAIIFYMATYLIVFILFDLPKIKKIFINKYNFKKSYGLLKYLLPLGMGALISSLITNIPNLYIPTFLSYKDLTIYSSVIYIFIAFNLFLNNIGHIYVKELTDLLANNRNDEFRQVEKKIFGIYFFISMAFSLIMYVIGELVLRIFYGVDFVNSKVIILMKLFTLVSVLNSLINANYFILLVKKRFKVIQYLNLFALFASIIILPLILKSLGLLSIGIFMILLNLSLLIAGLLFSRK